MNTEVTAPCGCRFDRTTLNVFALCAEATRLGATYELNALNAGGKYNLNDIARLAYLAHIAHGRSTAE